MTTPVFAIRTYTGAVLDHTITDASSVYFKEVVTDGVGHFTFTLPAKKGSLYTYKDITLYDKVKIWMGYDSVDPDSDTPLFVGRVGKILGPLSTERGYVRQISGLSQGEILLRRFKKNKTWQNTGASTIVTELATDLSLGTGDIESDSTQVTLGVETKRYFDLLQEISDYWYDAVTQVKKDFYVDVDNDLFWKSRPFRTSGVETLTIGDNIESYNVTRSVEPIKNQILVIGGGNVKNPTEEDDWTKALTNWSSSGTLDLWTADKVLGGASIAGYAGVDGQTAVNVCYTPTSAIDLEPKYASDKINFYLLWHTDSTLTNGSLVLGTGGISSYGQILQIDDMPTEDEWKHFSFSVGPGTEWVATGSPDWGNIITITFNLFVAASAYRRINVDGLQFTEGKYADSATDPTSQSNYGRRDLDHEDKKLMSDSDCTKRAEAILYQKKDPPVQLVVTTPLNTNILVGDRINMTIPAENISSVNFDVFVVEHSIVGDPPRGSTRATMVNTENIRAPIALDQLRALIDLGKYVRQLGLDEKIVT